MACAYLKTKIEYSKELQGCFKDLNDRIDREMSYIQDNYLLSCFLIKKLAKTSSEKERKELVSEFFAINRLSKTDKDLSINLGKFCTVNIGEDGEIENCTFLTHDESEESQNSFKKLYDTEYIK